MHHPSTSTYMQNFIAIEEIFCGRTDACTHARTYVRTHGRADGHLRPALLGRLCRRVDLINVQSNVARGRIAVLSHLVAANGFVPS